MNPTRAVTRILVPLAVTALALTACSSGTTSESASVAASAEEVMESESAMADEVMESESAMESEVMESESAMADDAAMAAHGSYITLADYQGNKDMYAKDDVVLFFHASWCPTCKATEENLNADPTGIPAGLTIVKVDYDNSDELKQQYGITTQHTFVQVDADGNELAKWTGTLTADDIAGQTA
jgi:thiol-disulfide isomerase/thioredoxin